MYQWEQFLFHDKANGVVAWWDQGLRHKRPLQRRLPLLKQKTGKNMRADTQNETTNSFEDPDRLGSVLWE